MPLHRKTYTSTVTVLEVDLSKIASEKFEGDLTQNLADFDIEVVGNSEVVTMTAKGSFSNSVYSPIIDGTFDIGGGKSTLKDVTLGFFMFTRAGTSEFQINLTRRIR